MEHCWAIHSELLKWMDSAMAQRLDRWRVMDSKMAAMMVVKMEPN